MNIETKPNWTVIINVILTAITGLLTGLGIIS